MCVCNITFLCPSHFQNTLKVSDYTYHSERICFYGGQMADVSFNEYISVSNGFSSPLGNFASFCRFNAPNSNPAQTSDDVTEKTNKKKQKQRSVQLQNFTKPARSKHLSLSPLPLSLFLFCCCCCLCVCLCMYVFISVCVYLCVYVCVISLSFVHRFFQNTRKVSDFTSSSSLSIP